MSNQPDNFNPRAPRGARLRNLTVWRRLWAFQSTRPSRGATPDGKENNHAEEFQSTRPSRGATMPLLQVDTSGGISIHAPLAGRDGQT